MSSPYRLFNADCLAILPTIPAGIVDMVMVDLPYGTTACKWDSIIPFEPMWAELRRLVKPTGAMVFTACQPFTTKLISSNMTKFRCEWIWDKVLPSGMQTARFKPMLQHESVIVFSHQSPVDYYPIKTPQKRRSGGGYAQKSSPSNPSTNGQQKYTYTELHPKSIITAPKREDRQYHPTQKPIGLLKYLIQTYTVPL